MENYFWNIKETKGDKLFVLIIYDITDNKRRTKFAKQMQAFGKRVQKSAFEAILKESVYERMTTMIPRLIDPKEDTVRVYRFSGYGNVQLFGNSEKIIDEEVIIV